MTNQNKAYEVLITWEDPYDIACSESKIHSYETWQKVSLEELKQDYTRFQSEYAPTTFEEWLAQEIKNGNIRKVAA